MRPWPVALILVAACAGPAAPDAALCRDLIARLCVEPRCSEVDSRLSVSSTCEATLLSRTGCASDDFEFVDPPRTAWLSCRAIVVRSGTTTGAHPLCNDVGDMLNTCSEVTAALGGP